MYLATKSMRKDIVAEQMFDVVPNDVNYQTGKSTKGDANYISL